MTHSRGVPNHAVRRLLMRLDSSADDLMQTSPENAKSIRTLAAKVRDGTMSATRASQLAGKLTMPLEEEDWIREVVVVRAAAMELTAYAIARRLRGKVSDDHLSAYMTGRKTLSSRLLQHVLRELDLVIRPR